jgi:hypothetical protein
MGAAASEPEIRARKKNSRTEFWLKMQRNAAKSSPRTTAAQAIRRGWRYLRDLFNLHARLASARDQLMLRRKHRCRSAT